MGFRMISAVVSRWLFCMAACTSPALAAPTLIANIHGYTLLEGHLQPFECLAFESGKVLSTGTRAAMGARFEVFTKPGEGLSAVLSFRRAR